MRFGRKRAVDVPQEDTDILVVVTMEDGRVIKGKTSPKMFQDAKFDLGRRNPRPDSLIYILTVIAHPADIKSIERG